MDKLVQDHIDKGHSVMNILIDRLYEARNDSALDILDKETTYGQCVHEIQDWLRLINYKRNYGND